MFSIRHYTKWAKQRRVTEGLLCGHVKMGVGTKGLEVPEYAEVMDMSYVESNLISGEQVLYKTGLHWIVLLLPAFFGALLGLVGLPLLFAEGMRTAGISFLIIAALLVLYGYMARKATEMAVTNKRIVIKVGLLSRRTFELLLSKVESIGVEEGLIGRIMGYGSVVVRGTGGTPEPFKNVAHPLEFRRQVQQRVEEREQK